MNNYQVLTLLASYGSLLIGIFSVVLGIVALIKKK